MSALSIITFTSDFGTREYYSGAVKGAILSVNQEVHIVDLSHEIASHDILEGAFTIFGSYSSFPGHTIHLVVVDPGVGSSRRGIVMVTERHQFVAPDNGVLSLISQKEAVCRVFSIEAEHYFRQPVSPTFHGRDIFGPIAGWLAKGIDASNIGPEISDYVRLTLPAPKTIAPGVLEGFVLHVDKFGNVITSFSREAVSEHFGDLPRCPKFQLNDREISTHVQFYANATENEPVSLIGSCGYYEIAVAKKPAAKLLGARRGSKVTLSAQF